MGALTTWFTGSRLVLAVGKWAAITLTISMFLLSLRRSAERAGRLAERLENMEKANEIQRRMLKTDRSYGTVRWHVHNLLVKCNVKSQTNLLSEFYQLIKH